MMPKATNRNHAHECAALHAVCEQRWTLAEMGGQLQELAIIGLAAFRGEQRSQIAAQ